MARIDSFLRLVADQRASDFHFSAGNVPYVRHDGDLLAIPYRTLTDAETQSFIEEMLIPQEIALLRGHRELDFVYDLENVGRFRVNVFQQSHGLGAVFRLVPSRIPTLDELMLPLAVRNLTRLQNGLVLVCGPTGSGKTTTLAAIIQEITATQPRHVITIEDPIEYLYMPQTGLVNQRQIGLHTESFSAALRSALRESPDVLMVGELRDLETISLALSAAETGVLVFGTLHTNSAPKAVDRIMDAFPDDVRDQMRGALAVLLRAVVSQRLIKRADGEGRVAVVEILLQTLATSSMIRENKVHQLEAHIRSPENEAAGMMSIDSCLQRHLREGLIHLEDALRIGSDREKLKQVAASVDDA